ncbi:MAG: phosphopentomutase [Lachnospiraceae bacterium]|nr:phosphopentomutase [Lachnospiraceae bacterium]
MSRIFLIVLDSMGIGAMEDAAAYGDSGTNTLKSVYGSPYFHMPNMKELGLFNIDGIDYTEGVDKPRAYFARLTEASAGKDTTVGHWEIAGLISRQPLPTFPNGFPEEVLTVFCEQTGRGYLCNRTYSGTDVIRDYGDEHAASGKLIVYTSADSVFQIAAHEDIVPLEELYRYCEIARNILSGEYGVGRVIARPFTGTSGAYQRTSGRHDYSLPPQGTTMLDILKEAGLDVFGIGKIKDIFAGRGLTGYEYTGSNSDGIEKTLAYLKKDFTGLCFINLVDFDMLYGHRNDIDGYAKALAYFDERLPELIAQLRDNDLLMITADHGCDPGFLESTDHTREYVPLLLFATNIAHSNNGANKSEKTRFGARNLGTRSSFADIAATILDYFGLDGNIDGKRIDLD